MSENKGQNVSGFKISKISQIKKQPQYIKNNSTEKIPRVDEKVYNDSETKAIVGRLIEKYVDEREITREDFKNDPEINQDLMDTIYKIVDEVDMTMIYNKNNEQYEEDEDDKIIYSEKQNQRQTQEKRENIESNKNEKRLTKRESELSDKEREVLKFIKNNKFEEFFSDEFDYEDENRNYVGIIFSSLVIIALITICVLLSLNLKQSKAEIRELNIKVQELIDSSSSTDKILGSVELEQANVDLKAEIDLYKKFLSDKGLSLESDEKINNSEVVEKEAETTTKTASSNISGSSGSSNNSSKYTVVQGDSFWLISKKVYGDGVNYQKILDANGLTENSSLKIGQELIIPAK